MCNFSLEKLHPAELVRAAWDNFLFHLLFLCCLLVCEFLSKFNSYLPNHLIGFCMRTIFNILVSMFIPKAFI